LKLSVKHKNGIIGTLLFHSLLFACLLIFDAEQKPPVVFNVLVDENMLEDSKEEKTQKEIDKLSKELEEINERIKSQQIYNYIQEQKEPISKPTPIRPDMSEEEYERQVVRNSLTEEEFRKYVENRSKYEDLGDEPQAAPNQKKESEIPQKVSQAGPSTVIYYLEGRKAYYIRVPAYRCEGASKVVVIIEVSSEGEVIRAVVDEKNSSMLSECYQNAALESAKSAYFSPSDKQKRQSGRIEYYFIPQ